MIRRALLLCGVAALAPAVLLASQAAASPGDIKPRFTPPSEPMVLTRTLVRTLRDGKQIIVKRSYAVRFVVNGDGYLVDGKQISASVDAPAKLASLAEIERNRVDEDMFPLRLNASGQIASPQSRPGMRSVSGEAAVREAHGIVDRSALSPTDKPEAHRHVNMIAASGSESGDWPVDLFNPVATDRSERQHLVLPGGSEGDVEVVIRVRGEAPGGLPAQVERIVTTRIGDDSRVSRETWTFGPTGGMD